VKLEAVVGANVARLREHHRLSQAELGEELGKYLGKPWTRQAVSAAEKGRRAFAVAELIALAAALKSDVAELLGLYLARPGESVELPGMPMTTETYTKLVEQEATDDVLRSYDLRTVRSLVPMLKEASWMTQLLYVSMRDLFLSEEERAEEEAKHSDQADIVLAIRDLMQTVQEGKQISAELRQKLEGEGNG
jgi:transcriptional regulator with XRE-family HTH domain